MSPILSLREFPWVRLTYSEFKQLLQSSLYEVYYNQERNSKGKTHLLRIRATHDEYSTWYEMSLNFTPIGVGSLKIEHSINNVINVILCIINYIY